MFVKIKLTKETLFYFTWILMQIHICIANSNAAVFSQPIISYISMMLFLIKILVTKTYRIKEILMILILLVGGLISVRSSGDMRVLWFGLTIIAAKGTDFDKTVKYSFLTITGCCIAFVLMSSFGVIDGARLASIRGTRLSFGLGHPNMCSAYFCLIMIHIVYLYFNKLNIKHIFGFTIGTGLIYYLTKSNTGFIVAVLSLIIILIVKYLPTKRFNSKIIVSGLIIGIVFFTVVPIIYSEYLSRLDSLMTGRLHQANYYYLKYGISFWGNDVSYDLNKWNTDNILDIGYAKLLINNVIFYYTLVVGGYIITLKKVIAERRRNLLILLGTMIIYMFTENVATYIFMNVSMLTFVQLIFNNTLEPYSKNSQEKSE